MATRRSKGFSRTHGRFSAKCGCLNHDLFAGDAGGKTLLQTKNENRRSSFQNLMKRNLISLKNKHVCSDCLKYSSENFCETRTLQSSFSELDVSDLSITDPLSCSLNDSRDNQIDFSGNDVNASTDNQDKSNDIELPEDSPFECIVDTLIEKISGIEWEVMDPVSQTKIIKLAGMMGKLINKPLYNDGRNAQFDYKNTSLSQTEWVLKRNPVLLEFLSSATGVDINQSSPKKRNAFTHSVEQIYYTRNLKLVTPFAFQRNVVQYSLTGSKLCTTLMGAWESAGSYTTVHDFVCSPCESIFCPKGHTDNAIDNNQKVGKTSGRIHENSKVPVDVCTSVSHIQINGDSDIQSDPDYMPSNWQNYGQDNFQNIISKVNAFEISYIIAFRNYRVRFVNDILYEIKRDQFHTNTGVVYDKIDITLTQKERNFSNQVCTACSYVYPDASVCCPKCKHNPVMYPPGYDPYHRTQSLHTVKPTITVGEPCLVNPNSENTVSDVLKHMKTVCRIPHDRKWTVVWSDGIPYLFACRLQQYIYECTSCNKCIDTRKISLNDHITVEKHDPNVIFRPLFGDLIFRPGPGHIELNMAKCLLNYCWPILMPLVKRLGFRTPKAQEVVKRGVDHHRSKQILLTLLDSSVRELLVTYVRADSENSPFSYEKFVQWVSSTVLNPSYLFLFDMTLTFLLAFKLYNEAVRKNNHQSMLAARIAFAPLFYSGNHPKYQELHLRDMCERVQYPSELGKMLSEFESFSQSGAENRGQGADFVHEEVNKFIKSFLPPGVPTPEIWQRVSRKSELLKGMKEKLMEEIGDQSESSNSRVKRFDKEVIMMRTDIRGHISEPRISKPHVGMSGEELDPHLYTIKSIGEKNYCKYKEHSGSEGCFGGIKLDRVFTLKSERDTFDKIENKTKKEIMIEIEKIIQLIPDESCQESCRQAVRGLKINSKKTAYIETYYTVCSELQEQFDNDTLPNDESSTDDHF